MADRPDRIEMIELLSGVAVLARLPQLQRARDAAEGRRTAGYVSGYRGSPLGTLDMEIDALKSAWTGQHLHFQPGLNEDLAATAVWGSQSAHLLPGARYEGVFALWYGKGPGVDRAGDVLKHANMAGTARWGGVLAICGDDHGAKSSTAAYQSEQALVAAMIPVLAPANIQELIDFGVMGWALSRWSGCWIGLTCPTDVVEQSTRVSVDPFRIPFFDMALAPASETVGIREAFSPLEDERRLFGAKLPAVHGFARHHELDRVVIGARRPRIGLVTVGKAHQDAMEALDLLGLDEAACAERGLAVYKIGLSWPVEPTRLRAFAEGLDEVLVLEEKRAFAEDQIARILYDVPHRRRPRLAGKAAPDGAPLLPAHGELSPRILAQAIMERLEAHGLAVPQPPRAAPENGGGARPALSRSPHYCAGCPHNISTKVGEDQLAFGGIGCHGMAMWMPDRPTRKAVQMGGEGANWLGQAPFVSTPHAFQNMGDGTYFHSGSLTIRAAVAAGVNITYKILYNDAVAMTGGQAIDGTLSVADIARQLVAERVREVVVVTDDLHRARGGALPPDVTVSPREMLGAIERRLAATPGVTAIVYDQPCAAELRRKRKAKEIPDPARRVFIHPDVCEACGDCGVQSNCVAVVPIETEFGRKRTIDQSACNKDMSCVRGFCPSFITVEGGEYAPPAPSAVPYDAASLPDPPVASTERPYGVLVAGIGGTGVISIGRLLLRAAAIEGKAGVALDVTGLAQKNGAVFSHLRFAESAEQLHGARLSDGAADLVLACDLVVAASDAGRSAIDPARTHIVHEEHVAPTAQIFADPDLAFDRDQLVAALGIQDARRIAVESQRLARQVLGDAVYANTVLLGAALQRGLLPVSAASIVAAIRERKRGAEANLAALNLGRSFALGEMPRAAAPATPLHEAPLEEMIARCAALLTDYQDARYAARFVEAVRRVEAAEQRIGRDGFAGAAAYSLWRLMAYKDEYEVARLYARSGAIADVRGSFTGRTRLSIHLAPPLLARRDPSTGLPAKRQFGGWILPAFAVLARLRGLRGTPLDLFGWQHERKVERALVRGFEEDLDMLCAGLTAENHAAAVEVAESARIVRGFGHVKQASIARAAKAREEALERWRRAADA